MDTSRRPTNAATEKVAVGPHTGRDASGIDLAWPSIVVAILGIVAGIVTLLLAGFTDSARDRACKQERSTVQAAIDAYMVSYGAGTVVTATRTNDMTVGLEPAGRPGAGVGLYPSFVRSPTTQGRYSWSATGEVTAGSC